MLLLAITTWMVFAPATQVSFLYALLWITLLYIAWTIVTIPYAAWGAELSGDYHERSRITGWRELFGIVGTPLLARGGNLLGKHRMWAVSILYTCVAFFPAWFLVAGDVAIFAFLLCFTGLTIANGGILGASMSADVIDIDTLNSGEQRGALFRALWALAGKFAAALGAGIALPILEFSGFCITPEGVEGLAALSFLYVAFAILCWLAAAAVIWNYPITAERHAEIRDQMARRASGKTGLHVIGDG